jgi:hypothetical protein
LRTSADYQLVSFQLPYAQIKDLILADTHFKPSQILNIEEVFREGTYTPSKDMASFVDSKSETTSQGGRRSFYPSTAKQPLGMESAETTLLSRRSFINLKGGGNALTVPAYSAGPFTRHLGSSSLSVISSHTLGTGTTSASNIKNGTTHLSAARL